MRVVKQASLYYKEGNSDKVYEVDISYVGGDRYVVDFRYGRRGSTLKSGTKTASPVALAQAEKIFDDLVASKVREGYKHTSGSAPAPAVSATVTPIAPAATSNDPREQAILQKLARPQSRSDWPLDRAIWRAGQLKLSAAVPSLLSLLGSSNTLRDYCIAWALGRIGDRTAIPALQKIIQEKKGDMTPRIARAALWEISNDAERAQMRETLVQSLPSDIQSALQQKNAARLGLAIGTHLLPRGHDRFAILDTLYLINDEHIRPALLDTLRSAQLAPNYFQRLRHIFKVAEFRKDAEVFGILAYRFEREPQMFDKPRGYSSWRYVYIRESSSMRLDELQRKIKQPDSPIAFGEKTKDYLRRRQWRTLQRMGTANDPDYVKMAVGLLLPYKDSDGKTTQEKGYRASWGCFSHLYAFNHVLYGGSHQYHPPFPKLTSWSYRPSRDDREPTNREEAFPKLWDQRPEGLLHLLMESECRPVHHFAAKAIRGHKDLLARLDLESILLLLEKPYTATAELAFDLAKERYRPEAPDLQLILAVVTCAYERGRQEAYRWVEQNREHFVADTNLLFSLVTSRYADTGAFANKLIKTSTLSDAAEEQLVTRLLAYLVSIQDAAQGHLKSISQTLLECFSRKLRALGRSVLLDLLTHPLPEVQELGGNILLLQDRQPDEGELIRALLVSQFEVMRGIGLKLLARLSDEALLSQEGLLLSLCVHPLADIRTGSRPLIRRLVTSSTALAKSLTTKLIDILRSKEEAPGIHADVMSLLKGELASTLSMLSGDLALQLTRAKSPVTQEMGGYLLLEHPEWADELDTQDIVKLANHEIRMVRGACFSLFKHILPRLRKSQEEMGYATKLLEAKWQDARELGFTLFEQTLTKDELTPRILVSICDSPRSDVQAFGQKMITRFFEEEHGQEYLLKLSEHPSSALQTFATNYLERFASDHPERLQGLSHYFLSILSRVNKGGVAKQRIYQFLEAEGVKSEASARVVAEIVGRVSATISVRDRARAIEVLTGLKRKYPIIESPLRIQEVQQAP